MVRDSRNIRLLILFFVVILIIMAFKSRNFFTFGNLSDIMLNSAVNIIAALGILLVLLVGEIDVSLGSILGVSGMVAAYVSLSGAPLFVTVLCAVATGGLLGLINGVLVVGFRIDSIIATLATMSIYRGLLIIITQGLWITALPQSMLAVGRTKILGLIPLPVIVALVAAVLLSLVLRKTAFGRKFYAVGSNANAAYLSGINLKVTKLTAFVLCGMSVGLASILFVARYNSVQANTGKGFEMIVIAAAVVGGTSIMGARGNVLGTVLGAILISTISTLLIFFNVGALWSDVVQGFIILGAVVMYAYKKKVRGSSKFRGFLKSKFEREAGYEDISCKNHQ